MFSGRELEDKVNADVEIIMTSLSKIQFTLQSEFFIFSEEKIKMITNR